MSSNDNLSVQLYGTSSLCFDKDYFMQDEISVDAFVRLHQSSGSGSLETLRDDLGIYLKLLRSAMIELINRDYADFVNLSTNLTGLDRLIEALKTPLGQLREEVLSVEKLLDEAITTTSKDLEKRREITKQKTLLQRLTQISNRLDRLESLIKSGPEESSERKHSISESEEESMGSDLVDRLAAEVNHLNFLVTQCEGAALLNFFKPRVLGLCRHVESGLERGLREGVMKKDLDLLRQTLRTYASLGSINHAHTLLRTLIKEQLEDIVSEAALKSDPRGLPGMYKNIIETVIITLKPLLSVTVGTGSSIVRGYSFIECSAWPEVVAALETRVQHIFNPGNPSAFHKRYCESMDFVENFEKELQTIERVEAFRELPEYNRFMDQWNLPVYFQIRYQEIGQVVECSLCEDEEGLTRVKSGSGKNFIVSSTQAVWDSLLRCYNSEVFLLPLLHRFWKLTLLILSRHRSFLAKMITTMQEAAAKPTKEKPPSFQSDSSTTAKKSLSNTNIIKLSGPDAAVILYHDIDLLSKKIPTLYTESLEAIVAHLDQDKIDLIKNTLDDEATKQSSICPSLAKVIVDNLTKVLCASLRQVGDTPRLYRRTNRASPTQHQPYINNTAADLSKFKEDFRKTVSEELLVHWMTEACTAVSQQYYHLTYDVLSSVHKMEESLRRLKKARDRGVQSGADTSTGLTDDDKIRMQIYLDVQYFGEQMQLLSVDTSDMEPYIKLLRMVQKAKQGKFTL